jgi:DNA-directed RNA polymerase subunit RPC12/RpoP
MKKYGNPDKIKRIRKNEKEVQKIIEGTKAHCSNLECKNTVVLKSDEFERPIMCGKCHKGFFVKEKPTKEKNTKKEVVKEKTVKKIKLKNNYKK